MLGRCETRMVYSAVLILSLLMLLPLQIQTQITFNPFPNPVNILESTKLETYLIQVPCVNANGAYVCNLVSPPNVPFNVWRKPGNTAFNVYYIGASRGGSLDYTIQPTYFLNVTCYNSQYTDVHWRILEVDVILNQAPIFSPTQVTTQVSVPATNGAVVHRSNASDAEKEPLTYSMTTSPQVNYFTIDSATGVVSITTTDSMYTATENKVTITVTVSDGYNFGNSLAITVTITNLNQRPDFINLPQNIHVLETAAVGSTLITLTVDDDQAGPVPSSPPVCTVQPANERYKFNLPTTGLSVFPIKLAASLDYETNTMYTISCEITDGYLSNKELLNIFVDNVNEPPVFDDVAYYCNLEESDVGLSSCNLGLHNIVSDPESDPIPVVAFQNGNNSNRFRYNIATTGVTFNVDYDVDNRAMADNVVLQLRAVDIHGASSTAPVYIKISDANDNTCQFVPGAVQRYTIDQSTTLGTIGKMTAIDEDLTSPNNLVSYEMVNAQPPESTNYILAYSDGTVAYTGLIPDSSSPKSYSLVIRCKDGGVPRRSAEATFVATYLPSTTTSTTTTTTTPTTTTTTPIPTTTTTEKPDIWDDPAFLGVFATLMCILALALLAVLCLCTRIRGLFSSLPSGSSSGFQEFCCPKPKPQKVEPADDYFNNTVRVNPDYNSDSYWRKGDTFETGKEVERSNPLGGAPLRIAQPAASTRFEL